MDNLIKTLSGQISDNILSLFQNTCDMQSIDMQSALESALIEYAKKHAIAETDPSDMSDEEVEVFQQVAYYQDLFDDMHFDEDSIVGKYTKVNYLNPDGTQVAGTIPIPHSLKYFDPQSYIYRVVSIQEMPNAWGCYNSGDCSLSLREDVLDDPAILLHEMIHMHEHNIEKEPRHYYRDILLLALYRNLKPKIKKKGFNLDDLIFKHANIPEAERIIQIGGEHDILFYLKSLDLDLKMGYELGTICGYGRIIHF